MPSVADVFIVMKRLLVESVDQPRGAYSRYDELPVNEGKYKARSVKRKNHVRGVYEKSMAKPVLQKHSVPQTCVVINSDLSVPNTEKFKFTID